ncbi:MAG: DUF1552 domain-containing protein [Pirellulales bacterium]
MSGLLQALNRRTFLRGAGVAVALPWLEAMTPATSRGAASTPPVRMAFVFFPNGAIMDGWKPQSAGTGFELPATLQPLNSVREDLLIISGLAQDNGRAKGDGPGDHARSAASFLTGAHPVKTSGADIRVGMSVDQAAAEKIGARTRLPSLEIGIERGRQAGSCDSGYSCAYSNTISWKNSTTPMAKEIQPRLVYERLFGAAGGGKAAEERDFFRQSILDLVAEDARRLQQSLGRTDRRKIDEYFSGVRELEQRIERAEQETRERRSANASAEKAAVPPAMELPEGVPSDLQQHIRLMYDLLVLAFRTDSTRVASFMLANEGSNRSYPMVGVTEGHHQLSHHQGNKEKIEKIQKIDQFLTTQFAYFIEQMRAVSEGEGTLLDHSLVLYGSGLSDGNRHRHDDLPILLAGRGGGTVTPGRHLMAPGETPLNNLFLSLLDRVGAETEQLGDSSGRLAGLDA